MPAVIDLVIQAQPTVDWDSYKDLIGEIVATGAIVTTLIDGESVRVSPEPGDDVDPSHIG